jgi:hypothetical protein
MFEEMPVPAFESISISIKPLSPEVPAADGASGLLDRFTMNVTSVTVNNASIERMS